MFNFFIHIHLAAELTGPEHILCTGHRLQRDVIDARNVFPYNLQLFLTGRIVHFYLQHKAVLLCFGQRIGSFLLQWVLRSQHQKRLGQCVSGVANGHLFFLHGFQQGTLHFGRSTVDFIGQNKVGKNGSLANDKFTFLLVVNHGAYHVGGQQVGGKLYAAESHVQRFGQAFNGECFGQAGHTFQQHVAIAIQTNQQTVYHGGLAHNDAVQLLANVFGNGVMLGNSFL